VRRRPCGCDTAPAGPRIPNPDRITVCPEAPTQSDEWTARDNTCVSVWDAPADTPEPAASLRARADLMRKIAELVQAEGRKQPVAAERCGVTQPRINDPMRRRVSPSSLEAHVNIATATGRRVSLKLETA
jgi:predicted XRE-type DNA-binding protein